MFFITKTILLMPRFGMFLFIANKYCIMYLHNEQVNCINYIAIGNAHIE